LYLEIGFYHKWKNNEYNADYADIFFWFFLAVMIFKAVWINWIYKKIKSERSTAKTGKEWVLNGKSVNKKRNSIKNKVIHECFRESYFFHA